MKNRVAYIDNMKAILIVLVVFGHLLERMPFTGNKAIYLLIYSFHMPAFVFISGLCFKKGTNWLKKLGIPYVIFQTIYLLYDAFEKGKEIELEYTKPVWILWYLMSMMIWYAICNCLHAEKKKGLVILFAGILISLFVGYEKTVGYYFSLSRTAVLFPFFWCGVYIKNNFKEQFENFIQYWTVKNTIVKVIVILISCVSIYLLLDMQGVLKKSWFYQSIPYNAKGYTVIIRVLILMMAAELTTCMLIFIPKCHIGLFSMVGQNTLSVFMLHGIIVKYLSYLGVLKIPSHRLLFAVLLTLLIVGILATPFVAKICHVIGNPMTIKKATKSQ